MSSSVRQLTFLQKLGIGIGVGIFKLWGASLRIKATPRALEILKTAPTRSALFLWHNRLAMALFAFQKLGRHIPLTGLVSASGDGALLAEVMRLYGISTARGSSSRRFLSATRELLAALDAGRTIVITPDGPRGPLYIAKEGSAVLAQTYAQNTFVAALTPTAFWTLKSWDQFILPRPFSCVTLDLIPLGAPTHEALQAALEQTK